MVPPPLDLTSLGGSAAADNDVVMDDAVMNNDIANLETGLQAAEQQETTTTTQQETTTTTQQHGQTEVSVPGTIAGGLHTNVYNVELGHDVRVKNIQTQKIETIEKGALIWVFDETTEFEHFFKFCYSNQVYQALQDEFEDGVIRDFRPKLQK